MGRGMTTRSAQHVALWKMPGCAANNLQSCHPAHPRPCPFFCAQAPAPPAEVKYPSTLEVLPLNPKCDTIRVSCSERLSEVEFK